MNYILLWSVLDVFLQFLKNFMNPLFFVPIFLLLLGLMVRYFMRVVGGRYS